MEINLLVETFPKLYHMAHAKSWEGIQKHGLLSTSALLDLYKIQGNDRERIESFRRNSNVTIRHEALGEAVIRDNLPMDDVGLQRALSGTSVTPREWYELLNGKVFFWLTETRLKTLMSARAYRSAEHCVLTIDTARFVDAYAGDIRLSTMNSGCTKPFPHLRDKSIFKTIADYPFEEFKRKKGGATKAIVELTVKHSVPNICDFLDEVTIRKKGEIVKQIWQR